MRTILQFILRTLLVLVFSIIILNSCEGQSKNLISITPIKLIAQKVNLHYEREINNNWSGVLDIQVWFIDRKGDSFLEAKKKENTIKKNNGTRYSLGVRRYFSKELNLLKSQKYYVGLNIFSGTHIIQQTIAENEMTLFGYTFGALSKRGKVNLISKGVNINVGFKEDFANGILIDLGVVIGKSWTNQNSDSFLLYDVDPTILPREVEFNKKISGIFIEPRLAIGFSF